MESLVKLWAYFIYACFLELMDTFTVVSGPMSAYWLCFDVMWLVVFMVYALLSPWSGCYAIIIISLGGELVLFCSSALSEAVSRNACTLFTDHRHISLFPARIWLLYPCWRKQAAFLDLSHSSLPSKSWEPLCLFFPCVPFTNHPVHFRGLRLTFLSLPPSSPGPSSAAPGCFSLWLYR